MADSGSGFNTLTGPISIDDSVRIRFSGEDGLDLDNGSTVTFRVSSAGQTIFAWGQVTSRTTDADNTYSEFDVRVRSIDQDTTTTGYPAGSAANMALSGFTGRPGNSHLDSLADGSADNARVQLQPATATEFNLNATTVTVTSDPATTPLSNSVVPLEMLVDWVLYTSTPAASITNLTTEAERTPVGTTLIATSAIQYSDNVRLPGTWIQYIGLSHNGSSYALDDTRSVFVSDTGTIITI